MFNQKNIPTLIIVTPILSIVLLISVLLYYLIQNQQESFAKEISQLEKEYIAKQKEILQTGTNEVISYIKYQKNLLLINTKKDIKIQMNTFSKNMKRNKIESSKYYNYINQSANSNTDFMIFDIENNKIIKNEDVFFHFNTIDELNKILNNKAENFLIEDETKWIEFKRFNNNYFWIYTNTNIVVAHGDKQNVVGQDYTHKKDAKNNLFVQKLVRLAIKHPEGGFTEFFATNENNQISKKIAYFKLYEEWNWIIGAGISLDQINNVILNKKKDLNSQTKHFKQTAMTIAFFAILFSSILSLTISLETNRTFQKYKNNVRKKELKLKRLNENLSHTVSRAIVESKKKDRAMLHQSRLAKMGEMLSMISHQWRQPLNQLSGIFMEIETKLMFKKADEKFLFSSSQNATNIIEYMSNTIEDFKNFFKPEKDKEEFLISSACENAITLVSESLENQSIQLYYKVINDKIIKGYPREYSQVVLNLLINAKDELLLHKTFNAHIYLIVNTIENRSMVAVKDNAGGIKIENIEKIFEPYFSTKTVQGTGLGLYMSKMIIEKNMNGMLTVRNTKKGALFKIII